MYPPTLEVTSPFWDSVVGDVCDVKVDVRDEDVHQRLFCANIPKLFLP